MESLPVSNQALPAGTRIEEFVIERVLGSGGFGITYLARDVSLGRQVVIKENLPVQFSFRNPASLTVAPRHSHGEDAENFKWSLENFAREAAMLASLDHPGIVKVLRSFEAFGTAYFVMPFVEGVALDELAKSRQGKPFSEEELGGLLERMLAALGYLHDRGIYHRDIKPGNLLITNDGIPVLIDFGSARQRLSERSMTVVESAGYTPFEQLQSRGNVGPWSDLYALGATVTRILTGVLPPKAMDRMRRDPFEPLAERPALIGVYSPSLLASIDKALRVDEDARWQDAREWKAVLRAEVKRKVPPPRPQPPDELPLEQQVYQEPQIIIHPAPRKGKGLLIGAITVAELLMVGGAIVVASHRAETRQKAEAERQAGVEERQKAEAERLAQEMAERLTEEQRLARVEEQKKAEAELLAQEKADRLAVEQRLARVEKQKKAEAELFAASPAPDLTAIMAKLDIFAGECRFEEASTYLKSLTAYPQGATRASLLAVADASATFLTDIKQDLAREAVMGKFPLKSGVVTQKIAIDKAGVITTADAKGITRQSKWADLSADALIGLHRIFVKNSKSEQERLRRHECAISYDWLAGNRERALTAADALSQISPDFKQRWDKIASGLPK